MIPEEGVEIVEVGPRDGLQNLSVHVDTGEKISLIRQLAACGIREIQVGAFVHPKVIPQFRDIREVIAGVLDLEGTTLTAMVPNLQGARDALESGIRNLVFFFSVSRSHNLHNVGQTPEESIESLKTVKRELYPDVDISVALATVFGCPFELHVKIEDILRYVEAMAAIGIRRVTLCDTVGFGNPRQAEQITSTCMENFPEIHFGVHLHNTRGLGLVNTLKTYETGIRSFESSLGGLGGCPFAPGASGNVATEDMVFMFNEMGLETGINMQKLLDVTRYLQDILPNVSLKSALFQAGLPRPAGPVCDQ
ncbi:MAG: hydroxymethylglutaryl-CoA lyase [Syntrophales bacterium]|nr:hydroxymethylglutaryl-CoA lyase [Syntrophales bacterium]